MLDLNKINANLLCKNMLQPLEIFHIYKFLGHFFMQRSLCPLHKGAEKSTVILHYKQNCHVSISSILDIVEVDVDVEQHFNNLPWGTIN